MIPAKQNMSLSFLNEPDPDEYIWKYVDLKRFISFLMEEKLYLSRLDYFPDAHEGISIEHILTLNHGRDSDRPTPNYLGQVYNERIMPNMLSTKEHDDALREVQKQYFGNSWFIGQRESAAMWSIYSNPDSVAISIQYQHLKKIFSEQYYSFKQALQNPELLLGKIEYVDFFNFSPDNKHNSNPVTGFYKDLSYKHEQEFRIILKLKKDDVENLTGETGGGDAEVAEQRRNQEVAGIDLKLKNFNSIPFTIVFHPSTTPWSKQNIKVLLNRLDLPFATKSSEIKWRLY